MIQRLAAVLSLACMGLFTACAPRSNTDPIPEASQRVVATPSAIAVLQAGETVSGLPAAITFGGARGKSAVFLQFAPEWRAHGAPVRAYLALEPVADEAPDPEPIRVEAWRVKSAWQASALHSWGDKPELAPPYASVSTWSSPARTLRVDVTELLRFAANNPELDQGIALIASGGSGHGSAFDTGSSGGIAPRLEVYQR